MRHCTRVAAVLALWVVGTALVEEDTGAEIDDAIFYSPQERKAHTRLKASAAHPVESEKHQSILDEVEAALVDLYDEGRGSITEKSLLLLGDLARRPVSTAALDELDVPQHRTVMNNAGIYYEDAFEKHNSTEGYFKLAQVVESLAIAQGTAGNETEKEQLLDQANKMFLVCGSKGHLDAMKALVSNCEKDQGFGPDGCPRAVKSQAREFNEELLKQSPDDPVILGKLGIFYAQGFGVDKPDLPKACTFADMAAQANADLLKAAEPKGSTKMFGDEEYDAMGYNTNNYILYGNCKYFNNFRSTGDGSDRSEAREILKNGLRMRHLRKADFRNLEDHLFSMIGPEEEPTYSGSIKWDTPVLDDLGDTWYMYIWASLGKGFFWSPRLRLGDMALKVEQKGGGLFDFTGDNPPLSLKADNFLEPTAGSVGQLHGKARRQTGEKSVVEGSFMLTLVPQGPRSEL